MEIVTKPARRLWNWLAPAHSQSEERARIGYAVRFLGGSGLVAIVPFVVLEWLHGCMPQVWLLVVAELVLLGALWLNVRGHSEIAALVLNAVALACGAALVFLSGAGYRDVSLLVFPAIPILAALLLPARYYWPMSVAVVLVAGMLILLQIHGLHPYAPKTSSYTDLIAAIVILINISVLAGYLVVTLNVSQRFSQATIDALPEEICVVDGNGEVMAVNRAWRRFAEANGPVPPGAFVGFNYLEVCERADGTDAPEAAVFANGLRSVLRGEREEFELEYNCPSHGVDYCFSAHVTRFPGQGPARVVIAHEDISQRRRAEQALRLSEERYRGLFERSPIGIYRTTPDGRILVANRALLEMLGFESFDELARRNLETGGFEPDYSRAEFRAMLEREGEVRGLESVWLTRDGRWLYVRENASAIRDSEGRVLYYEGTVEDITARKLAEEKLRESEEKHRHLVQNLHAGVIVHTPDTRIILANEQACRLLGVSEGQIEGKAALDPAWSLLRHDETQMPVEEYPVNQVLASGKPLRDFVAAIKRPSGDRVWVQVDAFPEFGPEKELRQVVVTFVDITARRRAEEERRQLRESLAQSDRLATMGMLAAGLAHEINNPLAYSLYNLESLCEDLPRYVRQLTGVRQTMAGRLTETGLRQALGTNLEVVESGVWLDVEARFSDALQGMRRIQEIAGRLGSFSRVERDELTPIELQYPIESAITIASNEIRYRATVVRDFGLTAPVLASEGKLTQVFLNLLLNAAQAIEEGNVEGNKVRVRTWQSGPSVFAEVQDTGCGIPPGDLDRIFDPFFTTKPIGVGSGLGLNIVRSIVAAYGGKVEVESEVGRGSRFVIRLPAALDDVVAGPAKPAQEREEAPMPARVLVIDDDAGIRKALRRILNGHRVVEAESGERACQLLSTNQQFDIILCDVGMPNMSGIDVHRWLREHHPQLAQRTVFLTGGASTADARDYLAKLQNPQVEKPFDSTDLEKLVADYAGG